MEEQEIDTYVEEEYLSQTYFQPISACEGATLLKSDWRMHIFKCWLRRRQHNNTTIMIAAKVVGSSAPGQVETRATPHS